jgi:hypothetical protein
MEENRNELMRILFRSTRRRAKNLIEELQVTYPSCPTYFCSSR